MSRTRSDDSSRSNWAKDKQHIEGQPAHGGRGIELLGDGDERDRSGVKGLDQLGKIGERAGEAVDLVDDHHVDLAGLDIGQAASLGQGGRGCRRNRRGRHSAGGGPSSPATPGS